MRDQGQQSGPHRGLPGRAARHRRQQPARKGGSGAVIKLGIRGADHHLHDVDGRVLQERLQGPAKHGAGPQGGILLGQWCARPRSPSGGDDQRGGLQGRRLYGCAVMCQMRYYAGLAMLHNGHQG